MRVHCSFRWIARVSRRGQTTIERGIRHTIEKLASRHHIPITYCRLDILQVQTGSAGETPLRIINRTRKGLLIRVRTGTGNQVAEAVLYDTDWTQHLPEQAHYSTAS